MLYIGVDLGTSAVKLLLMDEKGEIKKIVSKEYELYFCLLYTSPSPRDRTRSRMPSSA